MRRFVPSLLCLLALAGPAHAGDAPIVPSLIPQPVELHVSTGGFAVDADTVIAAGSEAERRVAARFNDFLAKAGRPRLRIADAGAIRFRIGPAPSLPANAGTRDRAGSYVVDIDGDGVQVYGHDEAGLFHGMTTVWQMLVQGDGPRVVLPMLHIEDAPRFPWRGYMLDSARQFHSVAQVEKILDTMALHKLNVFHWHLTDDQGWRIEIRKHPKLTSVGACRIPPGDAGVDPATGKPWRQCGHYSQDDIRRVVAYAAARHIAVVPEIDLPGHATAAIAAYPELGTEGKPIPVSSIRGIHFNLFNVEESTFAFLDDVFAEVAQLFPGQYIHVGGDEALKDQWKASARIQQRMRELGVKDESELQSWFIRRLERILHRHGKRLVGWDEILEGGLAPDATVMSWRGIEGGIEAAKQGHDVVMSPTTDLYLDYLQTDSPDEFPGRPAPRLIPMEKFYAFEPVPDALDESQRRHVLGLQANMWTTDNRLFAGVEHNTFPRLLAVAETGWTPKQKKDYADFLQRLPAWIERYEALGVGYARTPFEVLFDAAPLPGPGDSPQGDVLVTLTSPLGYQIRYDPNAGEPDPPRLEYARPLRLKMPGKLRVATFSGDRQLHATQEFTLDRASLLARSDEQLKTCKAGGPVLRMDDDGPFDPEGKLRRALFNVAIMEPCWLWENAPLAGIAAVEVRAGRLPYIFNQSAKEDAARKYLPAKSANGELDIRAGSCEGEVVATAPLPAKPDADGFVVLRAPLDRAADAADSLCIRFSGDFRPDMWVLDRIVLSPEP